MTLGSSEDTVAILYDNENAPFEMLDFALKKARKFMPCRFIVVADWDECPDQKRWERLKSRPGFTFRQIERTRSGANSLDYALADNAMQMCHEGVARFVFVTTDADFADIAKALRQLNPKVFLVGVGAEQANKTLRLSYDKFVCYKSKKQREAKPADIIAEVIPEEPKLNTDPAPQPQEIVLAKGISQKPERKGKKETEKKAAPKKRQPRKTAAKKTAEEQPEIITEPISEAAEKPVKKAVKATKATKTAKNAKTAKTADSVKAATPEPVMTADGELNVHIPKTLHQQLINRMAEENVDLNQLVTYIIMRGIE